MVDIKISKEKLEDIQSDVEIIFVKDGDFSHRWVRDRELLKDLGFKGKSEEVAFLPSQKRVYVGVDSFERDEIRIAISKAINALKKCRYNSYKIGSYVKSCPPVFTKSLVEGALLGSYEFDRYKSENDSKKDIVLTISLEEYEKKELSYDAAVKAKDEATIIALSTNFAKDIVNTPPDDATPKHLAQIAKKLSDELENVECFVGGEEFLKEQGMGAFLAVSRASDHEAQFIHLSYKPSDAKQKVVFVGKGLTYDSGGLSLKPSEYMVSMKADKSGAAAVMAVLKAVATLKLPIEVHSIIGACENMVGGNAYKPDDVLRAKNGKTIEVKNTDAEGRLVLADCLCYANELQPDYLFDMATLTGACVVALGEYTIGVMGHNSKLKHQMLKAGDSSGELSSSLPFNRYLKKLLKSDVADICNIASSRYGGAITAALFLDNFVDEKLKNSWLHLDIAGPAFVNKAWGYNQAGASGAGVRIALYFLKELLRGEHK